MKRRHADLTLFAAVSLCLMPGALMQWQSSAKSPKETPLTTHAAGPFDVKLTPQDEKTDATLGRFALDKQYHGDLEAMGKGQMLTASTEVKGSGAYVAVERVTGTLHGRSGSFALQHSGTMTQGVPHLLITVVPDSGTGQLAGMAGTMNINIASDGKHSYQFEYTLPKRD
jgi:hypothetical protein